MGLNAELSPTTSCRAWGDGRGQGQGQGQAAEGVLTGRVSIANTLMVSKEHGVGRVHPPKFLRATTHSLGTPGLGTWSPGSGDCLPFRARPGCGGGRTPSTQP